jgi:hypothetical protein
MSQLARLKYHGSSKQTSPKNVGNGREALNPYGELITALPYCRYLNDS